MKSCVLTAVQSWMQLSCGCTSSAAVPWTRAGSVGQHILSLLTQWSRKSLMYIREAQFSTVGAAQKRAPCSALPRSSGWYAATCWYLISIMTQGHAPNLCWYCSVQAPRFTPQKSLILKLLYWSINVFESQNTPAGSVKLGMKVLPFNPAEVVTHGRGPLFVCAQSDSASDLCECLETSSAAANCALSAENSAAAETKCWIPASCTNPAHSARWSSMCSCNLWHTGGRAAEGRFDGHLQPGTA